MAQNIVRSNLNPGAVISTDMVALENYKKYRNKMKETDSVLNRIATIENTLQDIQSQLKILMDKNNDC